MRKGMWSAAALVTLVAGAVVVFGAPSLRAADTRVALGSKNEPLKFIPAEITVPVGSTVEWFNDTDLQHDVSAEDGSFDSNGLLGKGEKYAFTFTKAGDFKYVCNPHKPGMAGVVKVTGAATPTTAATTPTTQAGSTATTATTAAGQATTTTAKAATGASSSTTTTAAANGTTTTTLASPVTPPGGPDTAAEATTTTTAAHGGGEEAAADHGAEGEGHEKKEKKKNSPIGIAFASLSTVLLAAIAGKLLASKS